MFKKFKSLFIIEDTNPEKDPKTPETTSESKKEAFDLTGSSSQAGAAGKGQIQDKFLDVLFQALENSNQDGFDYMEYKDFLKSLANVPMDDHTRYKSAFATAQTMGATKEKILASAKHYLNVLASEQSKFQEALDGQRRRNLTGKQEEIRQLEQTIDQKQKDIEKLNADINAHRQQITTLEAEISVSSEKLNQTAHDFDATYQALLGQIESDVKNIESHL